MNFQSHMNEIEYINKLIKSKLINNNKEIDWEIMNLIPNPFPGNYEDDALSAVYRAFKKQTNIPIELPVFSLLSYISAYLVKNRTKVNVENMKDPMELDLWVISLAQSGSSKTFSKQTIEKAIPLNEYGEKSVIANFEQASGPAGFVEELQDKNHGFYFQDECGQLIKQIEQLGSPMSEIKKYLLMAYDHNPISRKTKKDKMEVEEPVLTMLWLNTIEGFIKSVSDESLEDGFSQRFLYVWAQKEIGREMEDYALYNTQSIHNSITPEIEKIFNQVIYEEYYIDNYLVKYWEEAFRDISIKHFNQSIKESFYRRVMFSSFKYAVIFHIIFNKQNNIIDYEDMTYALKTALFHLYSLQNLLEAKVNGFVDTVEEHKTILNKVKQFKLELDTKGEQITARKIQRKISKIKTAEDANYYLNILAECS